MTPPVTYRIRISPKTSRARLTRFHITKRHRSPVPIPLERFLVDGQESLAAVLASAILDDHLHRLGIPQAQWTHHPASSRVTAVIAARLSQHRYATVTSNELGTLLLARLLTPSTDPPRSR